MKVVQSQLAGKTFEYDILKHVFKELGFSIGEGYTYTYQAFDYILHQTKINEYFYLRVFVDSVKGYIEKPGCEVKISEIEIFKAMYHNGIFRDDEVPAEYIKKAQELLKKIHERLGVSPEFTIA